MAVTPKFESFVAIDETLQKRLNKTWARVAAPVVKDLVNAMADEDYAEARDVAKRVDMAPVFDENAGFINFMMTASLLFGAASITSVEGNQFVKGVFPDFFDTTRGQLETMIKLSFQETVRRAIVREVGLQEAAAQDADDLKKADIDFVLAERLRVASFVTGKRLVDIGANLNTSRLVQFGALSEMQGKLQETYRLKAVLDSRTSQICQRLHGRTFKINRAVDMLATALGTQNPAEMAGIHPWLKGDKASLRNYERLSNKELSERYGVLVPPFHPNCRTIVVRLSTKLPKAKFTPVVIEAIPVEDIIIPTIEGDVSVIEAKRAKVLAALEGELDGELASKASALVALGQWDQAAEVLGL